MSDNPSKDLPAGDPPEMGAGEEEIDSLLEGASELAGELGEEVGTAADSGSPRDVDLVAETNSSVDAQLDELESVLGEAAGDLDEAEDQPSDPMADASDEADEAPADQAPPENEPPEPPAPAEPATGFGITDDDLEEFEGSVPEFDDLDDQPRARASAAAPANTDADDAEESPASQCSGLLGLVLRVADKLADALDMIDRPFGWVAYRIRRWIGYTALALLFAGICTLILGSLM